MLGDRTLDGACPGVFAAHMGLGWKTVCVAVMALVLLVLTIKARRSNYEKFRATHSRRKYRIPADPPPLEEEEDSTQDAP